MLAKIQELEADAYNNAKSWVPTWANAAINIVLVLAMTGAGVAAYYYFQHDHAVLMTQEQIKSKAELAKNAGYLGETGAATGQGT